jgi:hypothetical protein
LEQFQKTGVVGLKIELVAGANLLYTPVYATLKRQSLLTQSLQSFNKPSFRRESRRNAGLAPSAIRIET